MADPTTSAGADDDDIALGDITEDTESLPVARQNREAVLATFREEWQRELVGNPAQKGIYSSVRSPSRVASQGPFQGPQWPPGPARGSPRAVPSSPSQGTDAGSSGSVSTATENVGSGGSGTNTECNVGSGGGGGGRVEEEIRPDVELKATELFNKAVELEQSGQLYEAIQFYRRAMTLVPDIEFRVHSRNVLERTEGYRGGTAVECEDTTTESDLDEEELQDLVARFQMLMTPTQAMCVPQFNQEAPHISCLPPEMLERIMCWVVGSDLDMRSLEQVSRVCQGFYLVARNPEIWHKACHRIWGINCGVLGVYGSWREMFIHRPHPRYNGCYISRTTYFRAGESSFQDQNYQPWHLVQYYRYVRFFTDGIVAMLTTSEEPATVVAQLRSREVRNPQTLIGHYRIHGSNVSLMFKRRSCERMSNRRKGRRRIGGTTDVAETIFQIEFEIRPVKERPHWMLMWRNYTIVSIYYDDKQNISPIDVSDANKFPALAFSRVKSYALFSEMPLV
ncbi:F-box only protein 9 isoform X2 [Cherax quadricarinatus]|uniref:F-box only protein 9 isoform X2 n=1 Tax=Cherax quadricarinatus TaxID=27406 RepID=UPI002379C10A|nr:F-box only protein 9-like isoform X2 [Cherax quadricarinatus]